ncbi:hypothetical protein N7470_004522 [Penicillium chermesinum]|nr:hypothetical protein N7470_004522 [Penicillium chermesinum]
MPHPASFHPNSLRSNPAARSLSPGTETPSPASGHLPLAEIVPNRGSGENYTKLSQTGNENKAVLHKKTKSAVSLKSLRNYMEKKENKTEDPTKENSPDLTPKKAKSANSLSAILKRSQRDRKDGSKEGRDKENRSPSDLADSKTQPRRPTGAEALLRKFRFIPREDIGPAQQRNFYDYHQPSLAKPGEGKSRPKSESLVSNKKLKELATPTLRTPVVNSNAIEKVDSTSSRTQRFEAPRRNSGQSVPLSAPLEKQRDKEPGKRLSRVQAAISAFNAKDKEVDVQRHLDSKNVESEFEKLLDARNIPHNMRDRMRSLDTNIKVDFIQKSEIVTPHSAGTSDSRRGRGKESKDDQKSQDRKGSRSRSRSRGFTFGRGSSSSNKKTRSESRGSSRPRSIDLSQPVGVYTTLHPGGSTLSVGEPTAVDTAADPSDFVHYLREIQKPEMVEVGKIHKLRLLLRNETVGWVDDFIAEGGMNEIVQLIYRIMKMEWREDHEDTLLHEALLCLKGLCTTSKAMAQLTRMEGELFPALLKMLFDEEKKGPSEFTTRGIIINLLFTQLAAVAPEDPPSTRAERILSYLRDPSPDDENQPVSFIAEIYQARPYRVWCKEVTNTTKEVFWIFLHHLNVIPLPKVDQANPEDPFTGRPLPSPRTFSERHFPAPRPPVPAAPYVGGVEWDATNYLAAHLDLMNAIIASLPTVDARNRLRGELRASGFEKVMGGSLRTCKEKFYSAVHECLRTWVAAAVEDGWAYNLVREGPPRPGEPGSPIKSPKKVPGSPKKGLVDDKPPQAGTGTQFPRELFSSQRCCCFK